jgi:hypothetical protein
MDSHPLPFIPDVTFGDQTMAGPEAIVAMSRCKDDCLKACIVAASASIWGIRNMFLAQLNAVYRMLHPMHPNCCAVIWQTDAGKTHILWMLDVIELGIILIFIPLLTLSVSVFSKFPCANLRFEAVIIQHLNKLYGANKPAYKNLLEQCQGLLCSTMTAVFIFLSPQFIFNHDDARDMFIQCSHCTTHQVIALDKAHIHVQQGTLFCSKICALQAIFFPTKFGNQPAMK